MYGSIIRDDPELGGVQRRKKDRPKVVGRRCSTASEDYTHPFVTPRRMETADVPGELESEFREWRWWEPVFIDAPTGTGKSTFIIDKLLPFVIEAGGRLLIVSNRIALSTQYKNLVLKKYNHPARKLLTPLGIQEAQAFDGLPVVFCSYQGLLGLLKQKQEDFSHVVFDEAHFFCSDALFARDTGWLLGKLLKRFQRSVRIYLTATPWAVESVIAEEERKLLLPALEQYQRAGPYIRQLMVYRFPAVARSYQLHVLPSKVRSSHYHSDLVEVIKAAPSEDKWLIFVDSKVYGQRLAETLEDVAYLDSSRKEGPLWEEITTKSSFSPRILVTTPVADCGVNINDEAVKHIVLFSIDHVQFIQELGRKRLKKNEVAHVYVPELSLKQLSVMEERNKQLLRKLSEFESYPSKRYQQRLDEWYDTDQAVRYLIPIGGSGQLHVNPCAEQVVRQRELLYQEVRELEATVRHGFVRMVCRWLRLSEDTVEDALDRTDEGKLFKFLDDHCGIPLSSKEQQAAFANEFRELREKAHGPRPKGNRRSIAWGAKIIRAELEELQMPFRLEESDGTWIITRIEEGKTKGGIL